MARNLAAFARWFLEQPFGRLRPPAAAALSVEFTAGRAVGICLHRDPPWQVELFCFPPSAENGSFPPHRHPNVDSIEVFLAGEIDFAVMGKQLPPDLVHGVAPDGAAALCGKWKRVRSHEWHGGNLGRSGGVFLSIQKWRDGVEPTSVTLDWEGAPHASHTAGVASAPNDLDVDELEANLHWIAATVAQVEAGYDPTHSLAEISDTVDEMLARIRRAAG